MLHSIMEKMGLPRNFQREQAGMNTQRKGVGLLPSLVNKDGLKVPVSHKTKCGSMHAVSFLFMISGREA